MIKQNIKEKSLDRTKENILKLNYKFKKAVVGLSTAALITTATPAPAAEAATFRTPVGLVNIPDETLRAVGGVLAAIGGITGLGFLINSLLNGGTANASSGSSSARPTTPTTKPATPPASPVIPLTEANLKKYSQEIAQRINTWRMSQSPHLKNLRWSDAQYELAKINTKTAADTEDISHINGHFYACEGNIVVSATNNLSKVPERAVQGWIDSAGHRNAMICGGGGVNVIAASIAPGKYQGHDAFYVNFQINNER